MIKANHQHAEASESIRASTTDSSFCRGLEQSERKRQRGDSQRLVGNGRRMAMERSALRETTYDSNAGKALTPTP